MPVPDLSGAVGIAAGGDFTCALTSGGTVRCWGNNSAGQLGIPSPARSASPRDVPGVANVQKLSASKDFACAVTADGAVFCWGNNAQGQLGRKKSETPGAPAIVGGLQPADAPATKATGVATGTNFSCALLDHDGQVSCWGWNFDGQLGDGTTTAREYPAPVSNLSSVYQVVATVDSSSLSGPTACALLADSTVVCWGDESYGKLGNSAVILQTSSPVEVSGLAGVRAVAGGSDFFCAVTTAGNVNCWGSNIQGQLGTGKPELGFSASVVAARNLNSVTSIAAGAHHACALGNGEVKCWGGNSSGQLGNGTLISSSVPVPVI